MQINGKWLNWKLFKSIIDAYRNKEISYYCFMYEWSIAQKISNIGMENE